MATMVDLAARPTDDANAPAAPEPWWRRWTWRAWIVVAAVVVILAGGGITTGVLADTYGHPPALRCSCGYGFFQSHGPLVHSTAGDYDQDLVVARTAQRRGFVFQVYNPAGVSQTILGLPANSLEEKPRLAMAVVADNAPFPAHRTGPGPVTVPPHGLADLVYSVDPHCLAPGGTEYWTGIDVRVRTGWFTRTETIDLDGAVPAIRGTKATATGC